VRGRVIALAAAVSLLVFLGARERRRSPTKFARSVVLHLLPLRFGSFRVASAIDDPMGYEWLTYRDRHGTAVDVVVNYGARDAHDSITCFWARAEYPSWQRLVALDTAIPGRSAVFDVAIFTGIKATRRLVASTDCRANGCTERLDRPGRWIWPSLDSFLIEKVSLPIPVAITFLSPLATNDDNALLQRLKNFVGGLDLSEVCKLAATK
jgi:hypothetical protein